MNTNKPLSKAVFRQRLLITVAARSTVYGAYQHLLAHAPKLSKAEQTEMDLAVVKMLEKKHGISAHEATVHPILSGWTFDRKECAAARNALDYARQILRGTGKGQSKNDTDWEARAVSILIHLTPAAMERAKNKAIKERAKRAAKRAK